MPYKIIKGGLTDQVRQMGGDSLYISLAMATGGHRVDISVYALTRMMSSMGLMFEDINDARAVIRQMAEDAIGELELNFPDRERLIAEGRASIHREAGHG